MTIRAIRKWEYKSVTWDYSSQPTGWDNYLNKWGEDGWELVVARPDDQAVNVRLTFKREKRSLCLEG